MPNIYKTRFEDDKGNVHLFHSSADVVAFDAKGATNLPNVDSAQDALVAINEKAEAKAETFTLRTTIVASNFYGVSAPYTQTIPVQGILATDNPLVDIVPDNEQYTALMQMNSYACISAILTDDNQIIVRCLETKPDVDIPIQIKVIR